MASRFGNGERRGRAGALQRRGPHLFHAQQIRSQRPRLALAEFGQGGIALADQQSRGVRRRLSVADEDDHGRSSRPHSGQVMNDPSGCRLPTIEVERRQRDATAVAVARDDLGRARGADAFEGRLVARQEFGRHGRRALARAVRAAPTSSSSRLAWSSPIVACNALRRATAGCAAALMALTASSSGSTAISYSSSRSSLRSSSSRTCWSSVCSAASSRAFAVELLSVLSRLSARVRRRSPSCWASS